MLELIADGGDVTRYIATFETFTEAAEMVRELDDVLCWPEGFEATLVDVQSGERWFLTEEDQWALIDESWTRLA